MPQNTAMAFDAILFVVFSLAFSTGAAPGLDGLEPGNGLARRDVDATTLHNKVLCGYQGWFRCPGDRADRGWIHWSRENRRIAPDTLSFDMWPDLSDFSDDEKYPAPGFTYPDGKQAYLFSSAHPRTVERHFDWMQKYGIDGVLVQRFVAALEDPTEATRILGLIRTAANRTGRVFAVEYDMTGMSVDKLYDRLTNDWMWLSREMKITEDPRYLHHNGKPVLAVYGFFSDRFEAALAHRIIDFSKAGKAGAVTLVGGCQWNWRREKDREWARAFRRFDVISPWNVGNVARDGDRVVAATGHWEQDFVEARRAGMLFLPVIYPGFSWDNLQRAKPGSTSIPRRGGAFFWEQFSRAAELKIDAALVAMFDEVDEGTAIFKVTNRPPRPGHFATFEDRPADWYLRLTGEGGRLLRGQRPHTRTIPIKP
jgi:hypothetical protein